MHQTVREYVERAIAEHDLNRPIDVLEIGSANVNGSVRDLFLNVNTYMGIDVAEGPGVDRVVSSHDLWQVAKEQSVDLVLCLEMLEHDVDPWETVRQIYRVLKEGGLCVASARGNGFGEHNNPDRWRFMPDGWHDLWARYFDILDITPDTMAVGFFAVVRAKPYDLRAFL